MSEVSSYKPGTFCWVDLGTSDAEAAKKFYGELFGWEAIDTPAGEMTYTMLQKDGKDVAALYQLSPDMVAQGVPSNWMNYISVASADDSAAKAKELGATVVMEPMDVMESVGRMALVQDPSGAIVSLWEPKDHHGATVVNEPGSICWNELATRNSEAAGKFYTGLLDWGTQVQNMGEAGDYTTFTNGENMAGGMMQMDKNWPEQAPPHWMPYFAVEDCDGSTEKVKELGGQVTYGPSDIPGVGRFSLLMDPQGAAFSIIKLETPAKS